MDIAPVAIDFLRGVPEAYRRIAADIRRTPLERSGHLSRDFAADIHVKWECDQATGSFKLRGALNKLRSLSPGERARGVVSASTGNHGLAISHAAKLEGVGLKLFLPENAAAVKRERIEALGVDVEVRGASCDRAEALAREFAAAAGRVFVSPYNDPDIVLGAATTGLELAEALARFDDVLVPLGGGGLVAGIAGYLKAVRAGVRVFGVEPDTSAFMAAAIAAGRLVDIEERPSVADAVAGGIEPGSITFPLCRDLLDGIAVVPEALVPRAMALVHERHGRTVEGAGALPVAALLHEPSRWAGRSVVAVVSGGNISAARFREVTGRG